MEQLKISHHVHDYTKCMMAEAIMRLDVSMEQTAESIYALYTTGENKVSTLISCLVLLTDLHIRSIINECLGDHLHLWDGEY